jgi:hypothetical protein
MPLKYKPGHPLTIGKTPVKTGVGIFLNRKWIKKP